MSKRYKTLVVALVVSCAAFGQVAWKDTLGRTLTTSTDYSTLAMYDSCYDVNKTDTVTFEWIIVADSVGILRQIKNATLIKTYKQEQCRFMYVRNYHAIKDEKYFLNGKLIEPIITKTKSYDY